jgi:hypothetical protein
MAKVTAFLTVELDVTQQPVVEMARPSLEWGGFGARIDNLPYPCFRPRLLVNYVNLILFAQTAGVKPIFVSDVYVNSLALDLQGWLLVIFPICRKWPLQLCDSWRYGH